MIKTIAQSILYLFGLAENPILDIEHKSDSEWLADDWRAVGTDLRNAMNAYEGQTAR